MKYGTVVCSFRAVPIVLQSYTIKLRYKEKPPKVLPTFEGIKKVILIRNYSTYVLEGIRTPDLRLRRALLYPAELLGQKRRKLRFSM